MATIASMRDALRAWNESRVMYRVTQADFDRYGPQHGEVGMEVRYEDKIPMVKEGESLAAACDRLVLCLYAADLEPTPAARLSDALRHHGYVEVADFLICEARVATNILEGVLHDEQGKEPGGNGTSGLPGKAARPAIDPDVVDRTAHELLIAAVKAGDETGTRYFPTREQIAAAVAKGIGRPIRVEALFGTKPLGAQRVPRYPKFHAFWAAVSAERQETRSKRIEHAKAKGGITRRS